MKRYLTAIFILFSILSIIIGYQLDVRWNGIVSWGLALIFLIFAAYFTRYIPEKNQEEPKTCEEDQS